MKRNVVIITSALVLLALFVLGVSGVVHIGSEDADTEPKQDRLIGMLVTREYLDLFDYEGYFNANANKIFSGGEISGKESAAYQGRLYASPVEREAGSERYTKYVFDSVEGYALFSGFSGSGVDGMLYTAGDEAISDSKIHVKDIDEETSVELEGTIYVSAENGPRTFYCNPVYQAATGEIYATTGQGMTLSGDLSPGQSHSTWLRETHSVSTDTGTKSAESVVKMTVTYILPPKKLVVTQLDGESNIIAQTEYAPEELPEKLKTEPGTEYIVLASVNAQETTRELFQRSDEYLEAFFCREDGICVKTSTELIWS